MECAHNLKYQNRRVDYVKAFFQVLNRDSVSDAFAGNDNVLYPSEQRTLFLRRV